MNWFEIIGPLLSLAVKLMSLYISHRERGIGHDQAVAEALAQGAKEAKAANDAALVSRDRHEKVKDDTAFDTDFKRDD